MSLFPRTPSRANKNIRCGRKLPEIEPPGKASAWWRSAWPPERLADMTPEERLVADFRGAGLTVGPHPMAYRRAALRRARVLSAQELTQVVHGRHVRTAGCVIARQRPGTAKGFVFLSLEDETGISNAIISPDVMEQNRILIQSEKFLLLEGVLQNQEGVISVKVDLARAHARNLRSRDGGCNRRISRK